VRQPPIVCPGAATGGQPEQNILMNDSSTAEHSHLFAGQFELRDWKPVRGIEASNDALAREVAGALVSCQTAEFTLAAGTPEGGRAPGGASALRDPVKGCLRIDRKSFDYSADPMSQNPNRAAGLLSAPRNSRTLGFNLELRRNRLTATLIARTPDNKPVEMQTFQFYRVGAKGPTRRPPEPAPAPIAVANPAWQKPAAPAAAPQPAPAAQLSAEWILKLRNTQLSHAENDLQSGYGSSTYFERRVVLRLFDQRFVLERTTLTRVSFGGMTSSAPNHSRLMGTWTISGTSAARAWLQLTPTEGELLTYVLRRGGSDSLLVDGTPWRWGKL
jgi:hypothetical protein